MKTPLPLMRIPYNPTHHQELVSSVWTACGQVDLVADANRLSRETFKIWLKHGEEGVPIDGRETQEMDSKNAHEKGRLTQGIACADGEENPPKED